MKKKWSLLFLLIFCGILGFSSYFLFFRSNKHILSLTNRCSKNIGPITVIVPGGIYKTITMLEKGDTATVDFEICGEGNSAIVVWKNKSHGIAFYVDDYMTPGRSSQSAVDISPDLYCKPTRTRLVNESTTEVE